MDYGHVGGFGGFDSGFGGGHGLQLPEFPLFDQQKQVKVLLGFEQARLTLNILF